MTATLKIGIIVGTTRPTRFADRPVQWLNNLASRRKDATFEIVDLRGYSMPFFEESMPPRLALPTNEAALRWSKKMTELDGFIFVTAEYNHGIPAVLKNALDCPYRRSPTVFLHAPR
jgi:NAD(P)H-dependent FMN reductase